MQLIHNPRWLSHHTHTTFGHSFPIFDVIFALFSKERQQKRFLNFLMMVFRSHVCTPSCKANWYRTKCLLHKRIVYHKMNRSVLKMKFGTFEKRCSTEVKVETDDWLIDDSNVSLDISKEIQCTLRHNILIGCLELFNKESLYRINVVGQSMMIFFAFYCASWPMINESAMKQRDS